MDEAAAILGSRVKSVRRVRETERGREQVGGVLVRRERVKGRTSPINSGTISVESDQLIYSKSLAMSHCWNQIFIHE